MFNCVFLVFSRFFIGVHGYHGFLGSGLNVWGGRDEDSDESSSNSGDLRWLLGQLVGFHGGVLGGYGGFWVCVLKGIRENQERLREERERERKGRKGE